MDVFHVTKEFSNLARRKLHYKDITKMAYVNPLGSLPSLFPNLPEPSPTAFRAPQRHREVMYGPLWYSRIHRANTGARQAHLLVRIAQKHLAQLILYVRMQIVTGSRMDKILRNPWLRANTLNNVCYKMQSRLAAKKFDIYILVTDVSQWIKFRHIYLTALFWDVNWPGLIGY